MASGTPLWSVREGTPADMPALQELFSEVFGKDRSEPHYRWKFGENPAGEQILAVAEHEGRIVGQYALWPMRLQVGRETVLGAQSLDTMTHPDYRGQGMFTRLAKEAMGYAAARGVEVLFGFPNDASYPGFVRKLDWDHTGDVGRYVRVLHPGAYGVVPGWARPAAEVVGRAIPRGPRGATTSSRPTDAELQSLVERGATEGWGTYVARGADYLSWRFDPLSGMDYRWVTARDGAGQPTAVGVWGTDPGSGRALLCELLATSPAAAAVVLAETIRQAHDAGRHELMALGQRPGLESLLRRAGFIRRGGLPLIVRKLTTRVIPGNVHHHEAWAVFGADLDTF